MKRSAWRTSASPGNNRTAGRSGNFFSVGTALLRAVEHARINWVVFALFAAATMLHGTGEFHYDADHYWTATQGLIGSAEVPPGYWDLRGIFSAVIFLPAALLTALIGEPYAGFAVLLQNSLVLAWLAAFLVPRLAANWVRESPAVLWFGAFLTWAVSNWFAPYPIMDIYSAIGMIIVIILLRAERRSLLLLAGCVAGIVINLRPAYIIVTLLLILTVLVSRRWEGFLVVAGTALTLMPQVIANLARVGEWNILPVGSSELVALQSSYASYIVRYDTILGAYSARQFYCSPDMARLVGTSPPETGGDLAMAFLNNLPTSFLFAMQKIASAMHWPLTTPYANPVRGLDALFGASIVIISIVGIAILLYRSTRRPAGSQVIWTDPVNICVIVAGTAITLVSSATEARFALLLVLLGAAGVSTLAGTSLARIVERRVRWWVLATSLVTLVVLALGNSGLDHPAPRGEVSPRVCEFSQILDSPQTDGVQG